MRALVCALLVAGCGSRPLYGDPSRTYADAGARDAAFAVTVHEPPSLTGLRGSVTDPSGRPAEIACATCHAVLDPPPRLPRG